MAGREAALSSVRTLSQLEVPRRLGLGGASRAEEPMRDPHLLSCSKAQWLLMVHCSSSSESSSWGGIIGRGHRSPTDKYLLVPYSAAKCFGVGQGEELCLLVEDME
jgi:hypothetical protein